MATELGMTVEMAAQLDQIRQELLELGFNRKIQTGGAVVEGRR